MGTYILTVAVLAGFAALSYWIFINVWKLALKFFYYLLAKLKDVVKKVIVATKRFGKVLFLLYKRHENGKTFKIEYKEEEIEWEDVPEAVQNQLCDHDEVIVKDDDINPNEFD